MLSKFARFAFRLALIFVLFLATQPAAAISRCDSPVVDKRLSTLCFLKEIDGKVITEALARKVDRSLKEEGIDAGLNLGFDFKAPNASFNYLIRPSYSFSHKSGQQFDLLS